MFWDSRLVSVQKAPFISYLLPQKEHLYLVMAKRNPIILFFILSFLLFGALCRPDYEVRYRDNEILLSNMKKQTEVLKKEGGLIGEKERRMIGSTAPACTFNECKGCRFKCSAEQVPVDANDPMNSAYRYKCLCHR